MKVAKQVRIESTEDILRNMRRLVGEKVFFRALSEVLIRNDLPNLSDKEAQMFWSLLDKIVEAKR